MIRPAKFNPDGHIYQCPESGLVVPSVTALRDYFGFGMDYSVVNKETMEFARSMGQAVDDAISIVESGEQIGEIDPRVQQCLDQFHELKEKAKWVTTSVHNGGPMIGEYGGMMCGFCPDLLGTLDGQDAVAEVKRVAVVGPGTGFQTAGYDRLLNETCAYKRRVVFQLWPDKYRLWTDYDSPKIFDRNDYAMFRSALAMCWFQINKGLLKVEDMRNGSH